MHTEEVTNKDLHYILQEVQRDVKDINEKYLPEINGRAKTTNGSVAEIMRWKERMTGAGTVILIVVLPLLTWALYQISTWDSKLQQALSVYELPTK